MEALRQDARAQDAVRQIQRPRWSWPASKWLQEGGKGGKGGKGGRESPSCLFLFREPPQSLLVPRAPRSHHVGHLSLLACMPRFRPKS
jgi:hypothetical protein